MCIRVDDDGGTAHAPALDQAIELRSVGRIESDATMRNGRAQLLGLMTEDDWKRAGTHTESGAYSMEDWLTIYAKHAHNHAAQIQRLREALDKNH